MDRLKLEKLFAGLCCSECKSDFTEDSIQIMREEQGLFVVQIVCSECNKSFGVAFLGLESIGLKTEEVSEETIKLEVQEGPDPISADEVIDAHKFLKSLDKDWQKHIPSDFTG